MKQLKSFLKQAAKDFRLVAKNGNRRPDCQPWVSPIENVNRNRTGNSSFSLTSLSCKRNSVHNTSVLTDQGRSTNSASKKNQGGQERNNSSPSKKKKNRELDPAKDYCNNAVQRSRDLSTVLLPAEAKNVIICQKESQMESS